MRNTWWLALAAILVVAEDGQAQSNLKAKEPFLSRLMKPSNRAKFFNESATYYKWSTAEPLPNQTKKSWTVGATTISDLTRVGDGQCVDFVKHVTGTTSTSSTAWIKGLDVVGPDGRIITMSGGTVIATFKNGKYSSEHTAVVLRRVGDALEVADQNYISGLNQAKVVGFHQLSLSALRKYSIVQVK